MSSHVQQLKKITISLVLGGKSVDDKQSASPVSFDFIYGVASEGLCPFETTLFEKSEGDTLSLAVSAAEASNYFGHLLLPLRQALGLQILPETINLRVGVTKVRDAENREIVQSLAKALGGGCGGSCDCGCS